MISFLAVAVLSFFTLCFGTYLADRLESRRCTIFARTADERVRRSFEQ